jgi:hypothetical protein
VSLIAVMDQLIQEFVAALGPHYVVMVGAPGVERPAILIPAYLMEPPRSRQRLVRSVRGSVVRSWYLQYMNQMRWAFVEEDAGNSRWILLHLWSEGEQRWIDRILFQTLQQPRRGHRVEALHGRRVSVSYSHGLEGQRVLVVEEGNNVVWWVLYLEVPDYQLLHMISIQMDIQTQAEEELVVPSPVRDL